MKFLILPAATLLLLSCQQTATEPSFATSRIITHVYYQDQNIAGISVELVQSGKIAFTDKEGLAEFNVSPGSFDVKVTGIQGPGPALRTVSYHLNVGIGETSRIEVFDCLPCL